MITTVKNNREATEKARKKAVKTRPGRNGGTLIEGSHGKETGRPPKLLKQLNLELKKKGFEPIKPSQIQEAFEIILNLSEEKIQEISLDKEMPFFLRLISQKLLSDNADEIVEKILDRTIGKPKLAIDHTSQGEKITPKFEGLSLSELDKEFERRGLPKPIFDSIRLIQMQRISNGNASQEQARKEFSDSIKEENNK